MSSPFLAVNHRNGTVNVFRYIDSSPTIVGNSFGAAETPGVAASELHENRVTQFKGPNDLYALLGGQVYQYNSGTGNWTSVHTVGVPDASTRHLGPYVVQVSGVPTLLVLVKQSTAANYMASTSVDGTVWNDGASVAVGTVNSGLYSSFIYRNRLHWLGSVSNSLHTYDPSTDVYASVAVPAPITATALHATCVFNDRVFLAGSSTGENRSLVEFLGSSFGIPLLVFDGNGSPITNGTKDCLFTDGTSMFYAYYDTQPLSSGTANGGVNLLQFDTALTPTDLTSTVIPISIRSGQGSGTVAKNSTRIRALIDPEANPGGAPQATLYISQNGGAPGTTWSAYRWNGNAALIGNAGSPNDVGGDAAHALSFDARGDGKRFWTLDELDIEHVTLTPIPGGERISFRPRSISGTEVVKIQLFYGTQSEVPDTEAQLVNPSQGSMNGNVIESVTADGAAKTVDWQAQTQGVAAGQRVQTRLRIFV